MHITEWDGVSLVPPVEVEEFAIEAGGKVLTVHGRDFGVTDIEEAEGGYSAVATDHDGNRFAFTYIPGG